MSELKSYFLAFLAAFGALIGGSIMIGAQITDKLNTQNCIAEAEAEFPVAYRTYEGEQPPTQGGIGGEPIGGGPTVESKVGSAHFVFYDKAAREEALGGC